MERGATAEIVGVVTDVLYSRPEIGQQPVVYLSSRQVPRREPTFIVRTSSEAHEVLPAIRSELSELDASVPVHGVSTIDAIAAQATGNTRLVTTVLSIFAAFATVLAVLGTYAVIAYTAVTRTREMGIRVALGAPKNNIARLLLRQGVAIAGAGVVIGLAGAWFLTRVLSALLYRVSALDPTTFIGAAALVCVATLTAGYIPARRATRLDPVDVLRTE